MLIIFEQYLLVNPVDFPETFVDVKILFHNNYAGLLSKVTKEVYLSEKPIMISIT